MPKEVKAKVKLQISAGEATPAPPLGPALAPHGIDMGQFCSEFNERTKERKGWIIPVELTIYEDRSFDFITKTPPTSQYLKKAAGIEKGSGAPLREKSGSVTRKQMEEIAEKKIADLNTDDLDKAVKIIEGTAKAMGLRVEG